MHVPIGPIRAKGRYSVTINLDREYVTEPCALQTDRLPSGSSADLNHGGFA